jgi:hypothetical protein
MHAWGAYSVHEHHHQGGEVRRRIATGAAVGALLVLAGCSSSSKGDDTAGKAAAPTTAKPSTTAAAKKVDCSDPDLSMADWTEKCGQDGSNKSAGDLHKQFGQTYAWPDGVKVSVIRAKVFTAYNKEFGERATGGATDFRLTIRITNGSQTPFDLGKLSTITDGATNGGEATVGLWTDNGSPLEGRLAPGVTATKTDDATLENRYGKKIVVTVQRMTDDLSAAFPEFTGAITN